MWLEPVAERLPQHACVCPCRSSLDYKMFPIEEIIRITGIEGKCLESRQRTKRSRSPFPSIAEKIEDAKCARARKMCIHRGCIPALKIKISARGVGWRF